MAKNEQYPTLYEWAGGRASFRTAGTLLTFCFTDIEGSTSLLARLGEAEYGQMLRGASKALTRGVDRPWRSRAGH